MTRHHEFAPAKINLGLHVTGRRADGYHLLDSLVVFADIGDHLYAAAAPHMTFTITGPKAADLAPDPGNLVLRAAALYECSLGADLTLEKHLPVAGGIGGGSSDAAAALRLLARLWHRPLPSPERLLGLGADMPVCLTPRPMRMRGIGDTITPLPPLPPVWIVLVNAGIHLKTPQVFAQLECKTNAPMPAQLPAWRNITEFAHFLAMQRNDLEPPATKLAPIINTCRAALAAQDGCLLARMSGSGATCFGLFAHARQAEAAAASLGRACPAWWIKAGAVLTAP